VIGGLTRFVRDRREGLWKGLEVMRGLSGRNVIIALVVFAVSAQVARNLVVLHGLGVDISVWDAVALLIASAAVGLLPVGPTLGATTAVLILGSNGVAVVAAAGALLTATGAVGALLFALWASIDRLRSERGLLRSAPWRRTRPRASNPSPAGAGAVESAGTSRPRPSAPPSATAPAASAAREPASRPVR